MFLELQIPHYVPMFPMSHCSTVPMFLYSSLQLRHHVLLCNHNLCRVGTSPYKRGDSFPSNYCLLFLSSNSNPYKARLRFWQACNSLQFSYGFFASQATITVGYLLSPVVMRRVDTRPQVMLKKAIYAQFGISCLKFNY